MLMPLANLSGPRLFGWTPPAQTPSSMRFPSNVSGSDTAAPYVVIQFADPQDNGFPFWGPANSGWTAIRSLVPHQQTGYFGQFWWCRNDGGFANASNIPYVGHHPYPKNQNNTGTTHAWEVATEGGDLFSSGGSADPADGSTVTQEQRYVQALRATFGTKTFRAYNALPSTTDYIEWTAGGSYGTSLDGAIPEWAVVIGDSPWYAGYQHERASMDLLAIKIIMQSMSEADILLEAADMSQLVTAAAQASIWWGKYGFDSVDDLTCDFGTGRSFTRVDASNLLSVV